MADGPLMSTTYPTGGGYTCVRCGGFVPQGCSHSCAGFQPMPETQVRWDRMSDERIADALERIAAALEAHGYDPRGPFTGTELTPLPIDWPGYEC